MLSGGPLHGVLPRPKKTKLHIILPEWDSNSKSVAFIDRSHASASRQTIISKSYWHIYLSKFASGYYMVGLITVLPYPISQYKKYSKLSIVCKE